MNAQQLKNSILQEAIMGRLVPQDANDEPASVLLDKIREEKKRLVKEGKLKKKDLEETPVNEDEIPFEIPESWEWVKLGDITEIARGGSPRPIKDYLTEAPNGLNWIKIGDTDKGGKYINSCKEKIKPEGLKKTRMVHPGDFLLTNSMSFGRPYITNIEGCIHDGWLMISPYAGVFDQSYLYYVLSSAFAHKQFCDKVAGAVVQNLNSDKVADSIVPLPPLAEQKRIVAKIEELLPKVEEYGKAQEALDKLNEELPEKLKKSILQEAIMGKLVPQDSNDEPASVLLDKIRAEKKRLVKEGKLKKKDLVETPINEDERPFEIPESWEWVRIKDIFVINPKVIADDDADAAFIPMEKIEACYGSKFSYEIRKWKTIKSSFTCFADGDVAFAKITPCFQNRKSMILKNLPNGIGAGTTELKVLRQYAETIERKYLLYFLASSYFIDEATFKGTANQQRIIVGYLENKIFPLPPLSEQMRIVAKIEELMHEIDKLKV